MCFRGSAGTRADSACRGRRAAARLIGLSVDCSRHGAFLRRHAHFGGFVCKKLHGAGEQAETKTSGLGEGNLHCMAVEVNEILF